MFVNGVRIGRKLTTAMRKRIRQVQLAALPALFAVAVIAVVLGVAVFPTGTSIFLTSPVTTKVSVLPCSSALTVQVLEGMNRIYIPSDYYGSQRMEQDVILLLL